MQPLLRSAGFAVQERLGRAGVTAEGFGGCGWSWGLLPASLEASSTLPWAWLSLCWALCSHSLQPPKVFLCYPLCVQLLTDHTSFIDRNASAFLAKPPHLTPLGSQELHILLVKAPRGQPSSCLWNRYRMWSCEQSQHLRAVLPQPVPWEIVLGPRVPKNILVEWRAQKDRGKALCSPVPTSIATGLLAWASRIGVCKLVFPQAAGENGAISPTSWMSVLGIVGRQKAFTTATACHKKENLNPALRKSKVWAVCAQQEEPCAGKRKIEERGHCCGDLEDKERFTSHLCSQNFLLDSLLSADMSASMGSCFQCHSGTPEIREELEGWLALSNWRHCT